MIQKLDSEQLQHALQTLTGWTIENGKLHKRYVFADFVHAFGFMATAAIAIEKANHHPEWANVYHRVTVDLTTHDAGGVTQLDVDLAKLLDDLATKLSS